MTKEELKQESEEQYNTKYKEQCEHIWKGAIFNLGYLTGAEPREKRIVELEKACDETQELLDKQIEVTYKLDKENAELKDKLEHRNCVDCSNHGSNIKLLKAKEIITALLKHTYGQNLNTQNDFNLYLGSIKDAEQFLKEVEK